MPIMGMEASWTLVGALLAAGILFALAELVLPSGGMLTVLSLAALGGAVAAAFVMSQTAGLVALVGVAILAPLLVYVAIRVWPHTPLARRIILAGPSQVAKAGDLSHLEPRKLEGRVGVTKTLLRPAGKMMLDGRPVDCMTEGDLVPPGRKVKIVSVHGSRVVVRPVEEEKG
jgi:membrane-bound serine protease (ClpP class)